MIEKSPKLATVKTVPEIRKQLNGKWKLLYSNSEMLDFYNGVTGFANVFPTSKFKDLSFEYFSDGYASDAKYFETLSSSLGDINAVVYANWDLVKEMSFMTNENSVVLRNYCVKVTYTLLSLLVRLPIRDPWVLYFLRLPLDLWSMRRKRIGSLCAPCL